MKICALFIFILCVTGTASAGLFLGSGPYGSTFTESNIPTNLPPTPPAITLRATVSQSFQNFWSNSAGSVSWTQTTQTGCWTAGLDFSGMGRGTNTGRWITMIAPQYGVTCNHSQPSLGEVVHYYNSNNVCVCTNGVLARTQIGSTDIELIQLSNVVPAGVTIYPVLPTNYAAYDLAWQTNYNHSTDTNFLQVLSFDSVSNNMQILGTFGYANTCDNPAYPGLLKITNCPFSSNGSWANTGAQSGTPVFLLISNQLVFTGSFHCSDAECPWPAFQPNFLAIQAITGPTYPLVSDFSAFKTVP